ncbi:MULTISPECIES: DUF4012 domain-containing protein [unclassified Pseudarthrobacter]|uniref:DUF4012 domain-containing protein n=1 Tax=unclassified Pseudarthrobacter TaxID=2647000 RepID=UPI003076D896
MSNRVKRRRRGIAIGASVLVGIAVLGGSAAWLGITATRVSQELQAANGLVPALRSALLDNDVDAAKATVDKLMQHTKAAREDTTDPLWVIAGELPWIGANFKAASEVALSADDVSRLGAGPLVSVFQSLDWKTLAPDEDGIDLAPLAAAEPKLVSASHAVRQSSDRLSSIDADELLPQISGPLVQARDQLSALRDGLDAAANTASLAPDMLGGTSPRRYLVLIQNNAELRASGGIPGALAILSVDNGKLTLNNQTSASKFGTTSPAIPVTQEQQNIYSSRLGKYMQDVNLTPDFPSAAGTARAMWEQKTGEHLDGVISVDPVALSYVLAATGPVQVTAPELLGLTGGLPSELTSSNVVQTLLSDVYKEIDRPTVQDAYFASAAQQIFGAISGGNTDATNLIESLTRGAQEGRVLLWSSTSDEQAILDRYTISGAVDGPSIAPAQFGVYFNDGTGAKMDYYVKRTVQLVKECPKDGYEQTTVRITSTNVAPEDAASALPAYVTGDGIFGVPPGSVQTNIVTYGPALANIESARLGGQRIEFAPYLHGNRPVGVISVRLAPGETQTVDFTFGKIVQHAEPNIFVTPTVEDIKDVILVTENSPCTPSP